MDTNTVSPQQARDTMRATLTLLAGLGARVLEKMSATLQAGSEIDMKALMALGKQLIDAAREINRMDSCEQRAAATELRRRQFEARQAGTCTPRHHAQRRASGDAWPDEEAQAAETAAEAQGRQLFQAAVLYAPQVLEHIQQGHPEGTLPDLPPALKRVMLQCGMNPDNRNIRQGLIDRMIESGLLGDIKTYPLQ